MKNYSLRSMWKNLKRRVSILTIISMVLTGLAPATSVFSASPHFTNEKYQFVDEIEIDEILINDGMFYIPHSHLEVTESEETQKYVFKVLRKGEIDKYEKVKLTMMDVTGKYDRDYKIRVIDKAFFSENVEGVNDSKSVLEYAETEEGEEYNYSDAIIDGTINSENIMTDEEKENYQMSDEEKANAVNAASELLAGAGFDTKVEEINPTTNGQVTEQLETTETTEITENIKVEEIEPTNDTETLKETEETEAEETEIVEETEKAEETEAVTETEETNETETASKIDETVKGFTDTNTNVKNDNIGKENVKENSEESKVKSIDEESKSEETEEESETESETETETEVETELTEIESESKAESTEEGARTARPYEGQEEGARTARPYEGQEEGAHAARPYEGQVETATMSEIVYGDEVVEFDTKIATLSSGEAYELVTGLKDDRKRVIPDRSGKPLDIINPNSLENKAFLHEGVEAVEEELKSAYVILNFKPDQVEKLIEITILNDDVYRGKKQVGFNLSSEDNKNVAGAYSTLTLIIEDDEPVEESFINFTKTSYEPKDGYVHVEMERTGDLGSVATVMLDSEDITAKRGRDYSEVHTKVVFAMGISKRHVNIPVVSTHIKNSANFKLKLQEAEGATVGDKGNTICVIKETDTNFKFANAKLTKKLDANNDLFGDANTESNSLFGDSGEKKVTRDTIRYESEMELQSNTKRIIGRKCNDNTYVRDINNGYGLEIFIDDREFFCGPSRDAWVWLQFQYNKLKNKEGYKGIEIEWSKGTKGKETDNGDIFISTSKKTLKSFKGDKWTDRKDKIWFENTTFPEYIDINMHRYYGYHYKSPTIVINSIKPIQAMYDVKLLDAKAPGFINKDGVLEPNNHHGGNAGTRISDGTGEMIDVGYIGKEVTVKINNDSDYAPYYVKNLYIAKDENGTDPREIASNGDNTLAKSISFVMTEDFLQKNKDYIHQIDGIGPNAQGSKDGEIYIFASLEKKPSRIRITKDDRLDVDIWGTNPTQETEKEYIYDYGIEDTIRLNGRIKDEYRGQYLFNGFEKIYIDPSDKESNSSINKGYSVDYCTYMLDAKEILLNPNIVKPDNTIVIKVHKNQDPNFDKTYGFMKDVKPTLNGDYYEYVVALGNTNIYTQRFEFKAKPKDEKSVAVWEETYKSPIKYVQDTFYFLGSATKEQNVITLSTEKADSYNYSINGTAYYEEQPLGSKTTGVYWQGAPKIGILIDDSSFGYTNEKGQFTTVPSKGKNGYYKRVKIVSDGDNLYKDIKLTQKNIVNQTYEIEYKDGIKKYTERNYKVDAQNILISNFNSNHPKVNFVNALTTTEGATHNSRYVKINGKMTTLEANVSSKKPDGTPYTYTYADENGAIHTATESITKVEFLVLDPKSHEIKTVIGANNTSDNVWSARYVFNKGNYKEYKADDVLYVCLTTDRKVGDGKGDTITDKGQRKEIPVFNETVYQAINTNIAFASVADMVPIEVDFNLETISPTSEELSLPIIGALEFFKKFGGISFKSETKGDTVKVKIGKEFRTRGNNFDEKGNEINDSDAGIKITKDNFKEGFSAMRKRMLDDGEYNEKLNTMTLGLPIWSIKPMVGIEFTYVKEDTGAADITYEFKSGSGFFGLVFDFRYTFYFCVAGVPVYVGGEVNLTLLTELGIAVDKGEHLVFSDKNGFNQRFLDELIDKTHVEFLIRATMDTAAYVGVGICGTLGVRGGFELNMKFIWNPTITKKYENVRPVGLGVSGAIKIWIDAIFVSIPIPVYSWDEDDWFKYGYFEDIENKNLVKNSKAADSNLYGEIDKTELKPTPRFKRTSEFVANEDDYENGLFGGTYEIDYANTLIEDSYDSSDPKIMSYDSDGDDIKDKALLIYLDDDDSRSDLDRSVLKYMIYDDATGDWSMPQVLQNDGTADFSPNMTELSPDRIVVYWSSRKTPVDNSTPKANLLKDMEIYSVFFDKTTSSFSTTIDQLTNDNYYDYYPKASYDALSGRLELYYLKNENVGDINDTDDLLNQVQTEVNGSQLMYRRYDVDMTDGEFKWLTSYYDYELPSTLTPAERTAFINKYQGQRIKDLSINLGETVNNNPNISDYTVYHSLMTDTSAPEVQNIINNVREQIEEYFDPDDPDAIPESVREEVNELALRLVGYTTNYSVVSYVVDEDGDPSTKDDTDMFVKIASNSDVKTIRITKNNISDMNPKLIQTEGSSYLFWIQNESMIKMISVSDLIQRSIDEDHASEGLQSGEVNIITTDKIIMSDKISNIEPFSDDAGNIYVAWQQSSDEILSDDEIGEEIDFKQDLYVAGLVKSEDPSDLDDEIYSWSNAVRFTDNGKVNNLPAATDIDNKLLLVNNQYNMRSRGDSYNITNSNLVSMTYKKKSSLEVMGVAIDVDSEMDGEKTYNLAFDIQNTGLYEANGFDYVGAVKFDGQTLLDINGTSNKKVIPAYNIKIASVSDTISSDALKFSLTEEQQRRLDKVTIDLNIKEHGIGDAGIDYSNQAFNIEENFKFVTTYDIDDYDADLRDYLRVEQVGEDFVIKGILINTGNIDTRGNEKIYVIDQDDWDHPIAESDYFELPMNNQLQFEIPVSGDKIKNMLKGIKDLVVYVANDDGEELSIPEVATLQVKAPYKFKVNGNSDEIRLAVGETLKLNTTYAPSDRYQNATMVYAIEDGDIAMSGKNTITGLKMGETTMTVTTQEFGGSTEVKVIVEKAKGGNGRNRYDGGGSGSGGGAGGGMQQNAPATTMVNTMKIVSAVVNENQVAWNYDPITNKFKLDINMGGQKVPAVNGFYSINRIDTQNINGMAMAVPVTDTYYFDASGNMVTGWIKTIDNKWYFFENEKNIHEGQMIALNWKMIQGNWYYFVADGSMLVSAFTPDGYQVGADGAWIRP